MWTVLVALATVFAVLGFLSQAKSVRDLQSGQSVSIPWIASQMIGAGTKLIYGTSELDVPLAINSAVCIVGQGILLFPLVKYKHLRNWEKALFSLYALLFVLMVITPYKGELLLAIAALNFASGAAQPAEVWQNSHTGVLRVEMLYFGGSAGGILSAYCWQLGYLAPAFTFSIYAFFQLAMAVQWHYVRRSVGSSS